MNYNLFTRLILSKIYIYTYTYNFSSIPHLTCLQMPMARKKKHGLQAAAHFLFGKKEIHFNHPIHSAKLYHQIKVKQETHILKSNL